MNDIGTVSKLVAWDTLSVLYRNFAKLEEKAFEGTRKLTIKMIIPTYFQAFYYLESKEKKMKR